MKKAVIIIISSIAFFRFQQPEIVQYQPMPLSYGSLDAHITLPANPATINRLSDSSSLCPGNFYNEKGELIASNGQYGGRLFVMKTTKTTPEIYVNENGWVTECSQFILPHEESQTTRLIQQGIYEGFHMQNFIEIQPMKNLKKMLSIVSKDDGMGGEKKSNNREYGGLIINGKIIPKNAGPVCDPALHKFACINNVNFHSHPSGTKRFAKLTNKGLETGTILWRQPPSAQDIKNAVGIEYVFGLREDILYIHNNAGIIATIPISTISLAP